MAIERLTKIFLISLAFLKCSSAVDFISANQTIRDGDTFASAYESFEMGFFSPGNSSNRYFGIWYKKQANGTVVWVANRKTPIANTSGLVTLTSQGVLEVRNSTKGLIWSSNSSGTVRNLVAQILDTGNLVIRDTSDNNPDNFIWQSFDFPADNFLPRQKFGRDLFKGIDRYLVQSKSVEDLSPGNLSAWIDTKGFPQLVLKRGTDIVFRYGPWNGLRFSGEPYMKSNPIQTFLFVLTDKEIYYYYDLINSSLLSRLILSPNGDLQRVLWIEGTQDWLLYSSTVADACDQYGFCGVHGICNINNPPPCECLVGFEPNFPEQWQVADWSHGCRRTTPLNCAADEGFRKYIDKKLPDTQNSWFNLSINLDECRQLCKNNCSCTAYANADIRDGGSGCIHWFGDLIDTRHLPNNGQYVYIRMAASELIALKGKSSKVLKRVRIILPIISALVVILAIILLYLFRKTNKKQEGNQKQDNTNEANQDDLVLPLFGLSELLTATNNFSINNKLGEGGFGPVYKGLLDDGREIAVKRLSKTSTQGLNEFKNEVICISKLQHRNLVKLLGCCIQGGEKTLVYEYMANKSLDTYIFDETQSKLLDWPQRWNIINGIARGLLYLHQDSRLRIIHRDLKASNILLDAIMGPKISDFGLAKSFGGDETEANTNRVVGTYGYMSPEYAGGGVFSVKSDTFSFGVLILEILSGKKNRGFSHQDHNHNLLGHAWTLYQEARSLELIDAHLCDLINLPEVFRSIHVGLLCVQQDPDDRPQISSVVMMLRNETALPPPKHPGYFTGKTSGECEYYSSVPTTTTTNKLTITELDGR